MQKARCAFFARNAHRTHKIYTHLVFILFWKNLSVFAAAGHPAPLHLRKMQKQMLDLPQSGTYKISFTLSVGQSNTLQTFYIVGVYKYTEDSYASMFGSSSDDDIQTTIYIPIQTAKAIAGAAEGWRSLTAVAAADARIQAQRLAESCDCRALTPEVRVIVGTVRAFGPLKFFANDDFAGPVFQLPGGVLPTLAAVTPEEAASIRRLVLERSTGPVYVPVDIFGGEGFRERSRVGQTLWEHFRQGGAVMIPIGILAWLCLVVFVERCWYYATHGEARMVRLWQEGKTYEEIGGKVGRSAAVARHAIDRGRRREKAHGVILEQKEITRTCAYCGKDFYCPPGSSKKYCCVKCGQAAWRQIEVCK